MRRWRKMTWVLIAWCALIIVWAIAGGSSAAHDCTSQLGQAGQSGCQAGAGLGILLILLIGFVGFVFFALIWLMSRPRGRDCPVCGALVKRGRTRCSGCGHDFAAGMGRTVSA